MTAGTETYLRIFPHGLGELPDFVQVEGKTEDGCTFSGNGSIQKNDDNVIYYGGVIFINDVKNI